MQSYTIRTPKINAKNVQKVVDSETGAGYDIAMVENGTAMNGGSKMQIKFTEARDYISMNGKSGAAPTGFIAAVKTVAARHGIEIIHLGWDGFFTHSVELTDAHKTEVQSEMKRVQAAAEARNAARCNARVCPKCGTRAGTYTTSRTVCDDCA